MGQSLGDSKPKVNMFDEHRRFRSCIFCGDIGKLTKEHIFGKSLAARFALTHQWSASNSGLFGPPAKKGSSPITNLAPPVACVVCNNERLSVAMNASLESLWALINGGSCQIGQREGQAMLRYWERVGLIVDVLTSDYQLSEEYKSKPEYKLSEFDRVAPPLYAEHERKQWTDGEALVKFSAHIGYHKGVLGLNPVVNVAHTRSVVLETQTRMVVGKRFIMAIGNLCVCLSMGVDGWPIPPCLRNLASEADEGKSKWKWPKVPFVSYEDFFRLYNPGTDVEAMISLVNSRQMRRKVERHSRRVGSFTAPPDLFA